MNDNESDLVHRIKQGDVDALAAFIEMHRSRLTGYIEKNLGPALRRKVEAEDMIQELSADCIRAVGDVEFGDQDPFRWLCQMAQRRIIDAHRFFFNTQKRNASREMSLGSGQRTGQAGLVNMLVASITSPSAVFSRDQKEFHLQQALAQLPAEHQEVIRLRYVDGMPTKQIAERLGKSDGSVRVILSRTIRKLSEQLGIDSAETG